MKRESDIDRFWAKIYCMDNGCLEFMGSRSPKGYGSFHARGRNNFPAHRFAWVCKNGPVPKGMCVLHRCDNPACCNVRHLFLGSNTDNVADKVNKSRQAKGSKLGKVTDDIVRQIRARTKRHGMISETARELGLDASTVWSIYHGDTWRHVS
jgi:hypothetical protein